MNLIWPVDRAVWFVAADTDLYSTLVGVIHRIAMNWKMSCWSGHSPGPLKIIFGGPPEVILSARLRMCSAAASSRQQAPTPSQVPGGQQLLLAR
jgi:hypothetical protein